MEQCGSTFSAHQSLAFQCIQFSVEVINYQQPILKFPLGFQTFLTSFRMTNSAVMSMAYACYMQHITNTCTKLKRFNKENGVSKFHSCTNFPMNNFQFGILHKNTKHEKHFQSPLPTILPEMPFYSIMQWYKLSLLGILSELYQQFVLKGKQQQSKSTNNLK